MKAYILLSTKPGTSLDVVKKIKEKLKKQSSPTPSSADTTQSWS